MSSRARRLAGATDEPAPLVVETSGSTGRPKRVAAVAPGGAGLGRARPRDGSARRAVGAGAAAVVRRGGAGVCRSLVAGHEPVLLDEHVAGADGDGWCTVRLARADPAAPAARRREPSVDALRALPHRAARRRPDRPRAARAGPRTPACAWSRRTARPRPRAAASTTACRSTASRSRSAPTAGSGSAARRSSTGTTDDPALTAEALVDGWFLTSDAGPARRGRPAAGARPGRRRRGQRRRERARPGGRGPAARAPRGRAAEVVGVPDEEWGNRLVAFVVGAVSPRGGARLGRGGAPAGLGAARSWSSSTRSRCSPTASRTGWPLASELA